MFGRRRLLISGMTAITASLLSRPGASITRFQAHRKAPPPLRRGSKLRAVNPGTWMDPETDFSALQQRCEARGWQLEIPDAVRRPWRYFS